MLQAAFNIHWQQHLYNRMCKVTDKSDQEWTDGRAECYQSWGPQWQTDGPADGWLGPLMFDPSSQHERVRPSSIRHSY